MKIPTEVLLAMSVLGTIKTKDIVDWAVESMVAGLDSDSLRILAGFDEADSIFELGEYFSKVKSELDLREPQKDEAIRIFSVHLAKAILEEDSDYVRLVSQISELCSANDYPECLMEWYWLDDGLLDVRAGSYPFGFQELYEADAREITNRVAKVFIEKQSEQVGAANRDNAGDCSQDL
ncbi:hypothetical protein [Sulfuriroseicoccus oceanibius]|uniref:Uncharacterized protein n=1 Tax=Sulfuriroseicoccus oceanibius TaxID=2707525 RepID=A0A6B3LCL0_9BACT|nr:hypothetical protein [Sulfuriroseicoccus oceanibius]QQL44623.1 hypothetical protein G3M56_012130 [Sulfuriroseicoccus oceanibius]